MKVTFAKPSGTYNIELSIEEVMDLILNGSVVVRPEHVPTRRLDSDDEAGIHVGGHQLSYKDCRTKKADHIQFVCLSVSREEE